MARLRSYFAPIVAIAGFAITLLLLLQARAGLGHRDEQVKLLRARIAQLERRASPQLVGLPPDEWQAYLSLPYEEFDATPGSGHRRFRDQPRDPADAGGLIEAYLDRHADLPSGQRSNLL